jgi:RND family efflux transporter MFP subunit
MTYGSPFPGAEARSSASEPGSKHDSRIGVEVVHPTDGGIERICVQPGTLEPYEAADLYAKASGYLSFKDLEAIVDIGSKVKKDQVLARISVPEYNAQVRRNEAEVEHAKARMRQYEAHLVAARATAKAAKARITLVTAQVKSKTAFRRFREKQYDRIKDLLARQAVDARLLDESEDHMEASIGAEEAAKEAVVTTTLDAEASDAKVSEAQADLEDAKAQVGVAEAELDNARVLLSYTVIKSPYDGIITKRNYWAPDFIRTGESGSSEKPLFSVERTDLMRVVVAVPDRDVPYVDDGEEAEVMIDAINGPPIKAKVSRSAKSEDPSTRTMRTEIDIPNPKGVLRRGMYGQTTIYLQKGAPHSVTIPSSALIGKAADGNATVRIVNEGHVKVVPVRIGADNGINVEVVSGLKVEDQVIVRASGSIDEGTPVTVGAKKAQNSGH